jgi:hypothetical protein
MAAIPERTRPRRWTRRAATFADGEAQGIEDAAVGKDPCAGAWLIERWGEDYARGYTAGFSWVCPNWDTTSPAHPDRR